MFLLCLNVSCNICFTLSQWKFRRWTVSPFWDFMYALLWREYSHDAMLWILCGRFKIDSQITNRWGIFVYLNLSLLFIILFSGSYQMNPPFQRFNRSNRAFILNSFSSCYVCVCEFLKLFKDFHMEKKEN